MKRVPTGIDEEDYTEYKKDQDAVNSKEFNDWVLTLNPKDVRDKGISKQTLSYAGNKIKKGIILNYNGLKPVGSS
jgi:hypothetical protein